MQRAKRTAAFPLVRQSAVRPAAARSRATGSDALPLATCSLAEDGTPLTRSEVRPASALVRYSPKQLVLQLGSSTVLQLKGSYMRETTCEQWETVEPKRCRSCNATTNKFRKHYLKQLIIVRQISESAYFAEKSACATRMVSFSK